MRALAFLRPPALLVLASTAALAACSGEGTAERDGKSFAPVLAGGAFETTSSAASLRAHGPARESSFEGGQSGGEGNGISGGSAFDEGPPQPCACMNAAALGTVLSISEGCAEVEVTAVAGPPSSVEVGDVLRGRLESRCRGSEPAAAGDEVLFQYTPGSPAGFSALIVRDGSVRFHFAGKQREASVGELTTPQCWSDQLSILREPGAAAAWRADQRREVTDDSYESAQCVESDDP